MNLSGRTCLITGANSGLGLATTKLFAGQGAHVIMVCRDPEKGQIAHAEVCREVQDASLELMFCDLASLDSVKCFINQFKETHSKLDVLFNNAAIVQMERTLTRDGLEMMFQTNYLAPFILTNALIDRMPSSARIINIGVPSQNMRINFDDLQSAFRYNTMNAFFLTKLYLLFFSRVLSKNLCNTGISVYVTNPGPGFFKSNLAREAPWLLRKIIDLISKTPEKAAENIAYLASSEELEQNVASVYMGRKEVPLSPYWADREIGERLWTVTEDLIRRLGVDYPMNVP